MNKKAYIIPSIKVKLVETESFLVIDSKLNSEDDNPIVIPDPDPYGGEFGASGNNIWDD